MVVYSVWVINKAGGLVFQRNYAGARHDSVSELFDTRSYDCLPSRIRGAFHPHCQRALGTCWNSSWSSCHHIKTVSNRSRIRRTGHRGRGFQAQCHVDFDRYLRIDFEGHLLSALIVLNALQEPNLCFLLPSHIRIQNRLCRKSTKLVSRVAPQEKDHRVCSPC